MAYDHLSKRWTRNGPMRRGDKASLTRVRFERKSSSAERELRERGNYGGSTLKAKPYRSLSTRSGVKAELDRLTSLIVRARDGRCVTCGTTLDLECSHFYSRRWANTRFSLVNCNAMCSACNQRHSVNDKPYTAFMVKTYGEDGIAELFELRNRRETPTNEDLRHMLGRYRCMLKEMS